mmetsp:Transcript_29439/g.94198  ORF Transcript_29439/g.94198 Transcript_29439/m.94198 type:complete len:258 (-) Transcript_29439:297-1070(-)
MQLMGAPRLPPPKGWPFQSTATWTPSHGAVCTARFASRPSRVGLCRSTCALRKATASPLACFSSRARWSTRLCTAPVTLPVRCSPSPAPHASAASWRSAKAQPASLAPLPCTRRVSRSGRTTRSRTISWWRRRAEPSISSTCASPKGRTPRSRARFRRRRLRRACATPTGAPATRTWSAQWRATPGTAGTCAAPAALRRRTLGVEAARRAALTRYGGRRTARRSPSRAARRPCRSTSCARPPRRERSEASGATRRPS